MQLSRRHFLLGTALEVWGQEPTFTTDVNVVTLLATVRDRKGHIVKDLNREDFLLFEEGAPQTITYFARESNLPLNIGLLVDTSMSQIGVLQRERRASYTFLDQVLREDKDQAFIANFDVRVEVLQGFTSSRSLLSAALDELTIPGRMATVIYEAIRECSENLMRRQKGRKAFILLSDGVSFRDKTSIETAIEYAQRSDTIIYSILFSGPVRTHRPFRAAAEAFTAEHGKKVMQRLAQETGGAYFEVSKDNPIEKTYATIEDALRNQYSIGYRPERPGKTGEYRKIKLTTKQPGLIVQTRDGYYVN